MIIHVKKKKGVVILLNNMGVMHVLIEERQILFGKIYLLTE